jgi:hypothetical protein
MKRLIPVLLLLLRFSATAQNYSCFVPDTVQYYTNNGGYVRGIRIDSVQTIGTDIIYYPFKTPRGYYELTAGPASQLDSTGGSWVGGKIIQQANGITVFDNYWGDTVTLNTQAALGDQWIFYQHFSSPYSYKAQVTAIDTMSFLGYIDSVKKIKISAYNGLNINTADSIHGFEIILSKSHGFVQTFDIYLFPYHPYDSAYSTWRDYYLDKIQVNNSSPGVNNSIFRIADYRFKGAHYTYNWNVGDVYQYRQCDFTCWTTYPMNHLYHDTINQVIYSGDTAKYISSGWNMGVSYFPYSLNYTFHQNIPMQYWGVLQQVYSSYMPEEKHQEYLWYFYPGDTSYCSNANRYRFSLNNINAYDMTVWLFEAAYFNMDYKQDLGLVYYYLYGGAGSDEESERKLIYYNRNGNTCGNYVPVSVTDAETALRIAKVYPNPASDELIIDVPVAAYNISIVNTLGQAVYTKQDCSRKQTINTSYLTSGIYYLKLETSDHSIVNKKIVIQH